MHFDYLSKIDHLLKFSESIRVKLIPGSLENLDKKGFTWELIAYDELKLELRFTFEHPKFISAGREPDTLKFTFKNTQAWIIPSDYSKRSAIPDGFV